MGSTDTPKAQLNRTYSTCNDFNKNLQMFTYQIPIQNLTQDLCSGYIWTEVAIGYSYTVCGLHMSYKR